MQAARGADDGAAPAIQSNDMRKTSETIDWRVDTAAVLYDEATQRKGIP